MSRVKDYAAPQEPATARPGATDVADSPTGESAAHEHVNPAVAAPDRASFEAGVRWEREMNAAALADLRATLDRVRAERDEFIEKWQNAAFRRGGK